MFSAFGQLREKYPEDLARIEAEEEKVRELVALKEYSEHPTTKALVRMCKDHIITARGRLARDRTLTEEQRRDLWSIIDAREWVVRMLARDVDSELAIIEQELLQELER